MISIRPPTGRNVEITAMTKCKKGLLAAALLAPAILGQNVLADDGQLDRGRYLTRIAGCNDCHTAGYAQTAGAIPESEWLKGDVVGWSGPWGTTYPANLRLSLQKFTEDTWVQTARVTQYRPPMPWFGLRDMTDEDLRAIFQFIRSLGPAGDPAPAYVPPGQTVNGPAVVFPEQH